MIPAEGTLQKMFFVLVCLGMLMSIMYAVSARNCPTLDLQADENARPEHTFDIIRKALYSNASQETYIGRKRFTLEGWNFGNGGLDDNDRMALGELYYNATSVFEFGLGESTRIAAFTGVPRYSGVDSDPAWIEKARQDAGLSHFRFYYGDIGSTMFYGHPANKSLPKIQFNYQIAPLALEDKPFDVYLVDGRYRVACACLSLLHAMKTGGDMERVRIGIHDNHKMSRDYNKFQEVADVVLQLNKLWVYKLRKDVDEQSIYELWQKVHNFEI